MIELNQHEGLYLDICRFYRSVFDTPKIQEDAAKRLEVFRCACLYVILSPYDNEQSDLIHRLKRVRPKPRAPPFSHFCS